MSSKEMIALLKDLLSKGSFIIEDRNELNNMIDYLSKIKAFSYEDGMKLEIINHKNNPFTLWANDIECKIVLWEGKCEEIYGCSKNDAIGEDFVGDTIDIIAKYEKRKARIDCRDIIVNGKQFNNIAYDKTHDGVERIFQTNCFKIKDFFDPQKSYSAEIGVITNSIVEQTEATEKAIRYEKKVEALLEKMSILKEEVKNYKQLVTPAIRKKLQNIHDNLSKLELGHNEFEKNCNKWVKYVNYCNNLELEIKIYDNYFQKIKNKLNESPKLIINDKDCDSKKTKPKIIV